MKLQTAIGKEKFMDKDMALKHLFGLMLESLMEGERTAVPGYGKHDQKQPQGPPGLDNFHQVKLRPIHR